MTGIYVGLTGLVAAVDQGAKWLVERSSVQSESGKSRKGTIEIRKVHNKGMMLGMFGGCPKLVKTMSFLATIAVFVYQTLLHGEAGKWQEKLGMALVSGGAVSNTLDRISRGYVVDYIGLRGVTYNIGDFAIFLGVFLAMCGKVFEKR